MTTLISRSHACENPTAQQAGLLPSDLTRSARHPHIGWRPEWSGYCRVPEDCPCSCHLTADEVDGLAAVAFGALPDLADAGDEMVCLGTCGCGALWGGFDTCHCPSCHLTFTSVGPYDFHRYQGHCRTPDELRDRGYSPNDKGWWRIPRPEDSLPRKGK